MLKFTIKSRSAAPYKNDELSIIYYGCSPTIALWSVKLQSCLECNILQTELEQL